MAGETPCVEYEGTRNKGGYGVQHDQHHHPAW